MKTWFRQFVLVFSFCSAVHAVLASSLDDACASYNQQDYAGCLKKLDALPASIRGAKADYYRALSLQGLRRYRDAFDQFQKVATQHEEPRLAALATQGLKELAHLKKMLPCGNSNNSSSNNSSNNTSGLPASAVPLRYVTDDKWKIQQPGFGGAGVDQHGMPEKWTFVKTSSGCGRH